MALHVFMFLLVVFLILTLTLLWRLDWFQLRPFSSRGEAKRTTLQRLLKPRSPHDCPACRLASTPSSGEKPPGSTEAGEHRGLRLSEPKVSLL